MIKVCLEYYTIGDGLHLLSEWVCIMVQVCCGYFGFLLRVILPRYFKLEQGADGNEGKKCPGSLPDITDW